MKLQRYKGNPILSPNPENWWESVATFNPGAIFKNVKVLKLYILKWYCVFPNKKKALEFEKYLKSGPGIAFSKKRFL